MLKATSRQLGKYEILGEIGRGGFATVYRARDPDLDRDVALKVLDPLLTRDPVWVERFRREARAVARLRHPHIVTIYEIGEAEGMLYIAMELIPGPGLNEVIARRGRLPWDEAMTTLAQVADALDYAHGEGILHRDLKPGNILLDERRGAVLTDFGFAKLVGESSMSVSISGGVVGTPAYIAPEVWDGEETTSQTDLYALACIVYEMLTGEVLFAGDTPSVVMRKHLLDGPQFLTEGAKDIPQEVVAVLRQALTREPERRVASATALVMALQAASGAAQPASPPRETAPAASRKVILAHPTVLGLMGISIVLALVLMGMVIIPRLFEGTATPTTTVRPTQTALPTATQAPTVTDIPTPAKKPTPVPPTKTPSPWPSDTPAPPATATTTPISTRTPTSTHTPTATPTKKPRPTNTSPATYPVPTLLEPEEHASLQGLVTFKWSYPRGLAAGEAFQVLIWRQGEPHNGAAEFWTQTQQTINLDQAPPTRLRGAGEYYWTVVVVQTSTRVRLSPEAAARLFAYSTGQERPEEPTKGPTQEPPPTQVPTITPAKP